MKTSLLLFVVVIVNFRESECQKKNILFFASDDMRPELGAYTGPDFPSPVHPTIHSPNLDALASKSLLLKRSYVQQAVCNPSRSSSLTGRRPDTTHIYDNQNYFRKVGGNYTTIPGFFKNNGYRTIGMGKIFHPGGASDNDDPISWTDPYYHGSDAKFKYMEQCWRAVSKEEQLIRPLPDTQIKEHAKQILQEVAPDALSGRKNFFVAVGLAKPHLPFVFPEEFASLYPKENVRLPPNPYAPVYMPEVAWIDYITEELGNYFDIKSLHPSGAINSTLPDDMVLDLRRAYYSTISYVDSLVGEVIAELERLGLANNTIISFWGDHGWQLGEHGEWCKHTNFEVATQAPMMVRVPGLTDNGVVTERLTEFVDLFPTLVEAAGFDPLPLCPEDSTGTDLCTEGASLIPLMKDPTREWKSGVFSQYPRNNNTVMGYTLRTDKYRYTEWPAFTMAPVYKPNWDNLYGVELYDHTVDPEENYNRFNDTRYQDVVKELSSQLRKGWRYSQPPTLLKHP